MQTDRDRLLAAIIECPGDDALRLIFADWLEENGDPERGEFIRVQMELARTPDPIVCPNCGNKLVIQMMTSSPHMTRCSTCSLTHGPFWADTKARLKQRERLRCREQDFLKDQRVPDKWCEPLTGFCHYAPGEKSSPHHAAIWKRGFVATVTLTSADWLGHADALTAAAPIEEVALTTIPDVEQDTNRIWFPGRPQFYKWAKRFGSIGAFLPPPMLEAYWPRIRFHLPPA
jgi:uncharacterized protein (TIGR02996 family)